MIELGINAPRRYVLDDGRRHVLVGLSPEETVEFEQLESQVSGNRLASDDCDSWQLQNEQRWQALYSKHDDAWRA